MRIARIRTFSGPNVHHHKPVLLAEVDLESLGGRESREFPGFNERLISLLPGLRDHTCAAGHAGAFIARLHDGTYFGHIVEHVALELSSDVGIGVKYGKTRLIREPSLYAIVVRYRNGSREGRQAELHIAASWTPAAARAPA
jgi:cyanophycin synthetase